MRANYIREGHLRSRNESCHKIILYQQKLIFELKTGRCLIYYDSILFKIPSSTSKLE